MAGIRRRTLLAGVLSTVVAAGVVSPARACGPYLPEALFTYELHPDLPLADFAAGKLGVIQPTYARSYLYVAYLQMHGGSFDADARRALTVLWDERLGRVPATEAPTAVEVWQKARAVVVGDGDPPPIDPMREVAGEVYQYYANCLDDAFVTAARTLEARAARAGRDDPSVRAWVAAQDQVFQNCNGAAAVIPPALPESATPAARADRPASKSTCTAATRARTTAAIATATAFGSGNDETPPVGRTACSTRTTATRCAPAGTTNGCNRDRTSKPPSRRRTVRARNATPVVAGSIAERSSGRSQAQSITGGAHEAEIRSTPNSECASASESTNTTTRPTREP